VGKEFYSVELTYRSPVPPSLKAFPVSEYRVSFQSIPYADLVDRDQSEFVAMCKAAPADIWKCEPEVVHGPSAPVPRRSVGTCNVHRADGFLPMSYIGIHPMYMTRRRTYCSGG